MHALWSTHQLQLLNICSILCLQPRILKSIHCWGEEECLSTLGSAYQYDTAVCRAGTRTSTEVSTFTMFLLLKRMCTVGHALRDGGPNSGFLALRELRISVTSCGNNCGANWYRYLHTFVMWIIRISTLTQPNTPEAWLEYSSILGHY